MTREEAIERIKDHMSVHKIHEERAVKITEALNMAVSALEQPEIIRCKECMNHGKEICYFWSHFYGTINTPDDGFCHKAERKTDD